MPEFWQALLSIAGVGALSGTAAWSSFCVGGAYSPQPRLGKLALATIFLLGLFALNYTGQVLIGRFFWLKEDYSTYFDRQGKVLWVHEKYGKLQSITDPFGQVPPRSRASQWIITRSRRSWPRRQTVSVPGREATEIGTGPL
jgi:hypothetical protein